MAEYEDENYSVICPFNSTHIFKRSRLIYHLSSCKDGKKNSHLYGKCKYNSLHIFRK